MGDKIISDCANSKLLYYMQTVHEQIENEIRCTFRSEMWRSNKQFYEKKISPKVMWKRDFITRYESRKFSSFEYNWSGLDPGTQQGVVEALFAVNLINVRSRAFQQICWLLKSNYIKEKNDEQGKTCQTDKTAKSSSFWGKSVEIILKENEFIKVKKVISKI